MGGWPDVADHGLSRVPDQHLVAGWYVLLAVAVVVALIAARRALAAWVLPHASLSAAQIEDAVAAGVARTINGSLDRMERRIAELSEQVQAIDDKGDERHDENLRRFAALEATTGRAWDGQERRRQRLPDTSPRSGGR